MMARCDWSEKVNACMPYPLLARCRFSCQHKLPWREQRLQPLRTRETVGPTKCVECKGARFTSNPKPFTSILNLLVLLCTPCILQVPLVHECRE